MIEKKELARNIAEYWIDNCPDDDFYDNCMEDILERIGHTEGPIPDEAEEIWDIIEREFI